MIDIFNGIIDDFVQIDKTQLKQEMMNICIKIRNELNTDDDTLLKEKIKKKLYDEYVDTNILSIDELNKEINEWIDYI